MKYKEAVAIISQWEQQEPNKFQAWTWFGRGLKEAERFAILNGGEDITTPLGKAVAEFEEHWRYERAEALAEMTRLDQEAGLWDDDEDFYFHLKDSEAIGDIMYRTYQQHWQRYFKKED